MADAANTVLINAFTGARSRPKRGVPAAQRAQQRKAPHEKRRTRAAASRVAPRVDAAVFAACGAAFWSPPASPAFASGDAAMAPLAEAVSPALFASPRFAASAFAALCAFGSPPRAAAAEPRQASAAPLWGHLAKRRAKGASLEATGGAAAASHAAAPRAAPKGRAGRKSDAAAREARAPLAPAAAAAPKLGKRKAAHCA
jgi:hypothetical protein